MISQRALAFQARPWQRPLQIGRWAPTEPLGNPVLSLKKRQLLGLSPLDVSFANSPKELPLISRVTGRSPALASPDGVCAGFLRGTLSSHRERGTRRARRREASV